eukprot:scaffold103793_cov65-Phaeocystis_antarctica.AAC.7
MPQSSKEEQARRALAQGVAQRFGLRRALPQRKVQDGLLRITPSEASGGRESIETAEALREWIKCEVCQVAHAPLASRSKRKRKPAERTCGELESLKTLLKPTPLRPMRALPSPSLLLLLPASQSARTSEGVMPFSLLVVHTAASFAATCRAQVGSTPGAYSLSSAFCSSSDMQWTSSR